MIGTTLGQYTVAGKIGAGGMGEVYRATDTKLGRDVAIKVLPAELAQDAERLARFEREAKLLASLNHPNIAHVYGFESATQPEGSAVHFLAMELVEGEDLAERLERGPIPIDEALSIAKQIAEALEEAHEKGIVHRDLKPANVKLTSDGRVKVLDFGLAKAYAAEAASGSGSGSELSQSPTLAHTGTQAGLLLGTAAYMSPEQARGKPVDKRTDIWAFGVVLWEMLTGKRLFSGETVSDVLAGVLTSEVVLASLPEETPSGIRELLRRCLERNPKNRLHDIADARLVIEDAAGGVSDAAEGARMEARRASPVLLAWAVAAAGFATALLSLVMGRSPQGAGPGRSLTRTSILMPTTAAPGGTGIEGGQFALSPDGTAIALVAAGSDGVGAPSLFVRELAGSEPRRLDGTENATYPFWSPDSRHVAFFASGFLRRVPREGGAVQRIAPAPNGRGGAWGPGGTIVFAPDPYTALLKVSASSGEAVPATQLDTEARERSHRFPSFLPDGRHFLFGVEPWKTRMQVKVASLDQVSSGRPLLEATTVPRFSPPNQLVFLREEALMAQAIDLARLEMTGEPRLLDEQPQLFTDITSVPVVELSTRGSMVYAPVDPRPLGLVWYDRQGRRTETPVRFEGAQLFLAVSHRGDRLAAAALHSLIEGSLWIHDLGSGDTSRITPPGRPPWGVVWSADDEVVGTTLDEGSDTQGPALVTVDSGEIRRPIEPSSRWILPTDLSSDGRLLVYSTLARDSRSDIGWLRLDGDGALQEYVASPAAESGAVLSPDGRFLAYLSDVSGRLEAYVDSFPTPSHARRVDTGGAARQVAFRADGRELSVLAEIGATASLFAIPLRPGSELEMERPQKLFSLPPEWLAFAAAPAGDRFYLAVRLGSRSPSLTLVENWRAQLEAKP